MSAAPRKSCSICQIETWHVFSVVAAIASTLAINTYRVGELANKISVLEITVNKIDRKMPDLNAMLKTVQVSTLTTNMTASR